MEYITKNCEQRLNEFQAPIKEVKRGFGRFCNMSCASRFNRLKESSENNKPNVSCAQCNKIFYKTARKQSLSKSGLFFCNRKCKDVAQRIGGIKEIHPSHYKTGERSDYRTLAFNNFKHECGICKYNNCIVYYKFTIKIEIAGIIK